VRRLCHDAVPYPSGGRRRGLHPPPSARPPAPSARSPASESARCSAWVPDRAIRTPAMNQTSAAIAEVGRTGDVPYVRVRRVRRLRRAASSAYECRRVPPAPAAPGRWAV